MSYCVYYQAKIRTFDCWFLVAVLRSFEHMTFDRTLDTDHNIFEFFVPEATEQYFLEVMNFFQKEGTVAELKKLPNRLLTENVIEKPQSLD